MIKVFHVITSVQLGGAENVAFDLASRCITSEGKKCGSVVEVFQTNTEYAKKKKEWLKQNETNVFSLHWGSKRTALVFASFSLVKLILKEKPSIVHSHTDIPDFVVAGAIRILKLLRKPIPKLVRTVHNVKLWDTHPSVGKWVESAFHNDNIVSVSEAADKAYVQLRTRSSLAPSTKTCVIYNGCEEPIQLNSVAEMQELERNKINILFCGRFELQKGVDVLISYLRKLPQNLRQQFHFTFVGSGFLEKKLRELVLETSCITILPPINNVSKVFNKFDALIMPSRFEGLPLVAIESSLCKVPVIASNSDGLKETLPIDWPLKFDLDQYEPFETIMKNIAEGLIDLKDEGNKIYSFAKKRFSLSGMVESYMALYNKIMKESESI